MTGNVFVPIYTETYINITLRIESTFYFSSCRWQCATVGEHQDSAHAEVCGFLLVIFWLAEVH